MDEITLQIEGASIVCKKSDLIENSDYFEAMFKGNFAESSQKTVKLKGVDLKSMNIILSLLWDDGYVIPSEDLLAVLETACMLQFSEVRRMCEDRVLEILNPSNCLKVWSVAERLDIALLFLKAKRMALEEFVEISDSDSVLELGLDELCTYLGNVYLKTDCEFRVFQTLTKWWYENCQESDRTEIMLKLLHCLDFTNLTDKNVKEMMTYPDLSTDSYLIDILNCLVSLMRGEIVEEYSEESQKYALFLNKCRCRKTGELPCLMFESINSRSEDDSENVLVRDRFRRKRHLTKVVGSAGDDTRKMLLFGLIYDPATKSFKKIFEIDGKKCKDLAGFNVTAYKEFVLVYGGEFLIGGGNWNNNIWVFDTFRDRWERKHKLPHGRRHFESCTVGDRLYIIAGIGRFRIVQDNLIYYDFKTDRWSDALPLPSRSQQIKCCNFQNRLFILCLNSKLGYFLDGSGEGHNWQVVKLQVDNEDDYAENVKLSVSIFTWKDKLYIKGCHLLGFDLKGDILVQTVSTPFKNISYDVVESIVCDSTVYTLYKHSSDSYSILYTLESFDLEMGTLNYVLENHSNESPVKINGEQFTVSPSFKIFPFRHYTLDKNDIFVNDFLKK